MPDQQQSAGDPKQDSNVQQKIATARNVVPTEFLAGLASVDPEACNAYLETKSPELYGDLFTIVKKKAGALLYARRMQIRRSGEAELYYLGKQLIMWDDDGASWLGASSTGQFLPAYDDRVEEEDWILNFYKAYGQAFETTASENVPPVPFIPVGSSREDLEAAKHASLASNLIARNNDAPQMMADYAYHGWTSGLMATYTRTVTDGNVYGWKTDPETGKPVLENGQKVPKSQVVISRHGGLDVTLPETGDCQREWDHWSFHVDLPRSKGMATYPWLTDISPAGQVTDDDILSRLFRVAVRANVPPRMPSEALDGVATLVRIWLKPSCFFEIADAARVKKLLDKFPDGVCLHYLGGTFCAAIPENGDKRWNFEFASAGRGTRRPGWGDSYVSLQDQCNILSSLWHDYIVHGAPTVFHADKAVNREALQKMENRPFQFMPMLTPAAPGLDVKGFFWASPEIDVPPSLIQRLNDITVGAVAQFITGIAPALTGVGLEGVVQETARGFERQIEKSQGKIALFYRRIRSLHWKTMYTAVLEFAESQNEDTTLSAPGKKAKRIDPVTIKKGTFCIYPEADEGRPVLFRDKREQLDKLVAYPAMAPSMADIDNLDFVRRVLGQPEWFIIGEDSWAKQGREIDELIGTQAPADISPEDLDQLTAAFPTIKLGPMDNHVVEYAKCVKFYNSEEGLEAQIDNPLGWANFLAHAALHKAEVDKASAQQPKPEVEKPISWTAALDKMPVEVITQKLAEAGLHVDPASVAAQKDAANPSPERKEAAKHLAPAPPVPALLPSSNGGMNGHTQ